MMIAPGTLQSSRVASVLLEIPRRYVYHSAQLRDLEGYIAGGGVLCREALLEYGPRLSTLYDTDREDRDRGLLGHVFTNLGDHAWSYTFLSGAPDIFGPIHFIFRPSVVMSAPMVTVRRRGVSSDALPSEDIVDDDESLRALYRADGFPERLRPGLKGEIEIHSRRLDFADLESISVMPLRVNRVSLCDVVRARFPNVDVRERNIDRSHLARLIEWASGANEPTFSRSPLPEFITNWMLDLEEYHANRQTRFDARSFIEQLQRFAYYLESGTLSRLAEGA